MNKEHLIMLITMVIGIVLLGLLPKPYSVMAFIIAIVIEAAIFMQRAIKDRS